MDEIAKLLTPPHNFAVVQLPGRAFPGVVMQGDTLHHHVAKFSKLLNWLDPNEQEEFYHAVLELNEQLEGALVEYEKTCERHGISLPYIREQK